MLEEQGVGGNLVSTFEMYTVGLRKGMGWVDETKGLVGINSRYWT